MARKQSRDKKSDNMSVLGETYRLSAIPGDTAVYPCRLYDSSWFDRLRHDQSFDYRRAFKRPRGNEEQYQSESLPKKFVSEEVVASHLQQLNLATSNTPLPSPVTTANTTATTNTVLPSSQSPTCSSSSPLLSVPLLTSLDLLASAARSCPLSIKTVASCPRSLEANKDKMVYDDRICTDNINDPLGRSIQSSSTSNYSTVVTSAQLIHSPDPSLVSHQSASLLPSLDERMNSDETDGGVYQSMRTSPGHHKRPACMLDDEEADESEERIEYAEGGEVLSTGPYTKRSKVDVRVTSASDLTSCDVLPLSLSLPHDQLQGMISDESSQCSSTDSSETSSGSSSKTLGTVVLEDGSDSSDGGQEPGPEKPLSLWLSPELQALSSGCRQESLLPPAILEKLHTPKGMELVPWVGGPSVLAKVEENQQELSTTNGSDSPPMESSSREETLAQESQQQPTSEDNLNDVSMEP